MSFQYFSQNGELLPMSSGTISLENINYQYGFGVYETLKVRNGIVYFVKQHVGRLFDSAKIISLHHPFYENQIIEFIQVLLAKNNTASCNIKILLIGGKVLDESLLIILPLAPLFPDKKLYRHGATVETTHYVRFLPNAKTLNMLPSFLLYTKAKENGHYDALLLDSNDSILEGTRTNFFGVQGTTLLTPPKELILDGVTRQTVISVARKNGLKVKEEKIPLSTISSLEGAFLTSTSSKIIPLKQIDAFQMSIPIQIRELMREYDAFLGTSKGIFSAS